MIKADILIDDAIHNLVYGDYVKILFDAPHNQGVNAEKYGIVRAKNWEEVYKIIGELNKWESHVRNANMLGKLQNAIL